MQIISESVFSKPVYHLPLTSRERSYTLGVGTKLHAQFNGENGNYALQVEDDGKQLDVSEVSYEVRRIATKWLLFKRVPMLVRHVTLLNGNVKKDYLSSGADVVVDPNTGVSVLVISENLYHENSARNELKDSAKEVFAKLLLTKTGSYMPFGDDEMFKLKGDGIFVGLTEASRRKLKYVNFKGKEYHFKLPKIEGKSLREVSSYDLIQSLKRSKGQEFVSDLLDKGELGSYLVNNFGALYQEIEKREALRSNLQSYMNNNGINLTWE